MPPRFIAQQLSCPAGFFAPIIGFLMNRHNAGMNGFAMRCLGLSSADQLLEVGFGGGLTLETFIASTKLYVGLDRSPAAVRGAARKFAKDISSGRAAFHHGVIESMPYECGSFDKFFTVNTIYFWSSLEAGFAEIYRVLRPGGRAVIGFLPKEPMQRMGMPEDIFTLRLSKDVLEVMAQAGFKDIDLRRPNPATPWNVIVGTRKYMAD